jgi:hypothetical protein
MRAFNQWIVKEAAEIQLNKTMDESDTGAGE